MPRISQLDATFSREEQDKLAQFLNANPALTVDAFRDMLADKGLDVARATAHEYKQKLEGLSTRMRQSRMLIAGLGRALDEAGIEGEHARVLVEIHRTLLFELMERLLENRDEGLSPQDHAFLAKANKDLMQSARLAQDYELKIREAVVKEEREKAAKVAGAAAKRAGISDEARRKIEEEILGLKR